MKSKAKKMWVVQYGPDSRHLHDGEVFYGAAIAKVAYAGCLAKAKRLTVVEYDSKFSEGDKVTILAEQFA